MRRVAIALCLTGTAQAQPADVQPPEPSAEAPAEVIVIVDGAPRGGTGELTSAEPTARDRRRALAGTSMVTVVHVDEREGETRGVAEALGATVGAEARSLGGLGSFTSLSVRGAAPGHTQVSVDGVPLSRLGSVTADLSRYDLDSFARVELYRGAVPVTLGGAGVGGALDLVSRVGPAPTGERWHLTVGAGSFGARSARVRFGAGDPDERAVAAEVGYAGATGDYTYFDDGGTNLTPADDRTSVRANNGFDQLDGVVRVAGRDADDLWRGGARWIARRQGVPGTGWDPALATSLATAGATLDGAIERARPGGHDGLTARLAGFVTVEAQRFRDPDDELGTATQDRSYLTVGGGAQGALGWLVGRHRATAAVELRADHYRDREVGAMAGRDTAGERVGAALAVADDLGAWGGRIAIEPAIRIEALRTVPLADPADADPTPAAPRHELLISPRVAGRVLATADLAVKASVGRYGRVPTALELFGDRGFIVGRPDLAAERGWAGDLGLVYAAGRGLGPVDRVYAEAAVFAARPTDVIALITTGGGVTRPQNLPGAELVGLELTATARLARTLTATANYTYTDARLRADAMSLDGKRLPGRPAHAAYVRADAARRWRGRQLALSADAAYTSGSFVDEANLAPVPRRMLFGAGAKVDLTARLALGVEVKNLLDRRIETVALTPPPRPDLATVPKALADQAGFPLPGRAMYVRLDARF